jgi:hypothetical protein
MSEETLNKDQVIASLMEANDLLQEELQQVRNNNRILRRVHSALRRANTSLRNQVAIAQQNDELFKELCTSDFGAKVTSPEDGGLPEPGTQAEASV